MRVLALHQDVLVATSRLWQTTCTLVRREPLALGTPQELPVPGRCGIGPGELDLYPTGGHTADGMAIWVPWARVLIVGDYLSPVEIPMISASGSLATYLETLDRLEPLV